MGLHPEQGAAFRQSPGMAGDISLDGDACMRWKRWILVVVLLVLVCTGVALAAISSAKVELTANGVHTRLLVPAGPGAIGLQHYAGTGEQVILRGHLDGPVVRRQADGAWSASWFCEDRVHHATGRSAVLRIDCAGATHAYPLDSAPVPPAMAPMPEKLVVLSDVEGNLRFLDAALEKMGVVDAAGQWRFGGGQLVVLGDSVDRGREAFAVLWRLHELARQAHAAGGAVRMVLGNHDQYILRGNISRAHPEHRYALRAMGGVGEAFGADTVIGAWLRAQPVVLKLGDALFAHGGVSPEIAAAGMSVDDLNAAMRGYWLSDADVDPAALDAVLGDAGVTQYRGYFRELDGVYPAASSADVDRVLAHFGVGHVVVGHSVVERIEQLHDGRVYAVDVNDGEALPEVLVYDNGVPSVRDIGVPRGLDTAPDTRTREFSLLEADDRRLLGDMFGAYRELSAVPQPY
jgi:hypothetical protein